MDLSLTHVVIFINQGSDCAFRFFKRDENCLLPVLKAFINGYAINVAAAFLYKEQTCEGLDDVP